MFDREKLQKEMEIKENLSNKKLQSEIDQLNKTLRLTHKFFLDKYAAKGYNQKDWKKDEENGLYYLELVSPMEDSEGCMSSKIYFLYENGSMKTRFAKQYIDENGNLKGQQNYSLSHVQENLRLIEEFVNVTLFAVRNELFEIMYDINGMEHRPKKEAWIYNLSKKTFFGNKKVFDEKKYNLDLEKYNAVAERFEQEFKCSMDDVPEFKNLYRVRSFTQSLD